MNCRHLLLSSSARRSARRATTWLVGFALAGTLAHPIGGQSDGVAQRFLLQAERLAEEGRVAEAIAEYTRIVDALPDSASAPVALLAITRLQLRADRPDLALRVAQQLLDAHPRSNQAASAAVLRTEVLAQQAANASQLASAIDDLEALLLRYSRAEYPELTARAEALVLIATLQMRLGEFGPASASLVEVLEDEPRGPHTSRAQLLFAETLIRGGRAEQAWASLQQAIESDQPQVAGQALAWTSSLHRFLLRPALDRPLWQGARTLALGGTAFKKPEAVAANAYGDVIVIDSAGGAFWQRDGAVQSLESLRSGRRPAFSGRNPLFVLPGSIDQPGQRDVLVSGGSKPKELARLEALGTGEFGEWFVIDRNLDGVGIFDRTRIWLGEHSTEGRPVDLANGSDGTLYVLTSRPSQIVSFDQRGQRGASLTLTARRPVAFDVDLLGNFYVLDEQTRAVQVLDREGRSLTTLGPILPNGTQLRSPSDVAVDGASRVYIADSRLGAVLVLE